MAEQSDNGDFVHLIKLYLSKTHTLCGHGGPEACLLRESAWCKQDCPAKHRTSNWSPETDRNTARAGQTGRLKVSVTDSDVDAVKEHLLNPRGQ